MNDIFDRDWNSEYTHLLNKYIETCFQNFSNFTQLNLNINKKLSKSTIDKSFCEPEKDFALFATKVAQ